MPTPVKVTPFHWFIFVVGCLVSVGITTGVAHLLGGHTPTAFWVALVLTALEGANNIAKAKKRGEIQ